MTKSFIQVTDALFGAQLRNFYTKLLIYATLLGFSTDELDSIKRDSDLWDYCLDADNKVEKYARDYKQTKALLRKGGKNQTIKDLPKAPDLAVPPPMVAVNIQLRFRQAAGKAKSNANYNKGIGADLGIEPIHQTFDPQLGKPALKSKINAGKPILSYVKSGFQGLIIHKDVGEGYVYLGTALKSKFDDTSSLPEPGTSSIWKYKAIYVWDGKETGHWSDEISVVVKG
jgi:hypothetical protein